jgi:uncharacterized protein (DUF305 family)
LDSGGVALDTDLDLPDTAPTGAAQTGSPSGGLRTALIAIVAVAALVVAVALGHLWGARGQSSVSTPSTNSIDAGFARDMSTHHQQAITMAGYARDNTSDSGIKVLAFDIETSQLFQVGEMQGWLDTWGLARDNPTPMTWMAGHSHLQSDGLMPGMATPAQMTELQSLHGKALDILFLQLMIHHHQGGIPMAQYAQEHATQPYVRDLAQAMINAQSAEVVSMEQLLRGLGAAPLPAPVN